jgi:hypothetical protein
MTMHDDRERAAEPTVAGPQSEAAVAPPPGAAVDASTTRAYAVAAPSVLSDEQRRLLVAVLDRIVPPRDDLAGAGGLGGDATIDRTLTQTPRLRRLFLEGLAEIALTGARLTGRDFLTLDAATQEDVLRAVEAAQPDFFAALVEHTYRGYYTHPKVQAAIGYPTRPPQPLGHTLAPFSEELLQIQQGRVPFWRRADP